MVYAGAAVSLSFMVRRYLFMKKRLTTLLIALTLIISVMPAPVFAASTSLDSKDIYYVPASDYRSGDCILTSSRSMIRRTCIMHGRGDWTKITNKSIRSSATIWGLLWNSFKVDAEGMVYQVDCGLFKGKTDKARLKEIKELLKVHPEGIVVHGIGAAYTGTHGVLAVEVKDGVVYAADSTRNLGLNNEGIQPWDKTTMRNLSKVSKYWYISGVSTSTKTEPSNASGAKKKTSTLRVKQPRTPTNIKQGKGFGIWGEVRSDRKIKKVTVKILDHKGKVILKRVRKPNKKLFRIVKLDKKIHFGELEKGLYTYQIIATDEVKTLKLVNKTFTVY